MKVTAVGHSLGGAKALYAGRALGIKAVAFNPGPLGAKKKPCDQCIVVRTKGDLIALESKQYADIEVKQKKGNFVGKLMSAHSAYPGRMKIPDIYKFLFLQVTEFNPADYVLFTKQDNVQFYIENGHSKAENNLIKLQKDLDLVKARVIAKMQRQH